MDKEKLMQGLKNIAIASFFIFSTPIALYIGLHNARKGSYLFLTIGIILLIGMFYFSIKGLKKIVEYLLEK
tara:strand:- start:191 stop:403 length:213 start_codon:yes stop_codon:yes gene_type:complete